MLADIQDVYEQCPEGLRDYEDPADFWPRAGIEIGSHRPDDVDEPLKVAKDDAGPQEYFAWCFEHCLSYPSMWTKMRTKWVTTVTTNV